jgi:group I intron endonuclease
MIIYKTTNIVNGKFYIGKDKHNNPSYLGSGKILEQAILKYGKENFTKEVLEKCDNYDIWLEREKYWIKELNATTYGYNIAEGGLGGDTVSNHPRNHEIRKKHSEWMSKNNPTIGKRKSQDEIDRWRESYGDKWRGKCNPNYGTTRSAETKHIQSEIRKEWHKNLSEKQREIISKKISESNKGKEGYWKGETNEKHSQWMTENNPFKGKKHTAEVKQMLSQLNSKPKTDKHKQNISLNSPNNKQCIIKGKTYRSVAEASRQLGLSESTVRGRVKNKNFKNWSYE